MKQRVTKLAAAQRQLRTAIDLYFHDGDDVSIHTLVGAARKILLDLLRQSGERSRLQETVEGWFSPERVKMWQKAIAEPENFF